MTSSTCVKCECTSCPEIVVSISKRDPPPTSYWQIYCDRCRMLLHSPSNSPPLLLTPSTIMHLGFMRRTRYARSCSWQKSVSIAALALCIAGPCFVVLSLVALMVVAEEKPLEAKKGKRGIFDFGYGYDGHAGYPGYAPYAHDFGHFDHGFAPYHSPYPGPGWLPHGGIIGAHTNTIITKKIGVPVPVPVDRHIPVPVKVPVAVPVPYPVVKHYPVPVVKHVPVPYPKPYPVPIVAKPLLHDPWLGPKFW
ncbi:hypothetical protein DMENIID0001_077750 [Sergentomyia squamirostris]